MAINFPDSPANNDSFTSNNKTWVFDGTVWNITSGTNSVADGAITTAKLASNAVHQTKLASNLSGITITTTANRDTDITSPFTGQFAFLTDTNACSNSPCLNGATCNPSNTGSTYTCTCATAYSGTNCQIFNACFNNPCLNGATCTNSGSSYICSCAQFYSGTNCQTCKLNEKK